MEKPPRPNRLAKEASPYLRQHMYNLVDWYPWGQEAFQRAKQEGMLIYLSIGYAACHWCHVMEKECFENPQIAHLLNKHFLNIKVDREELPQVDALYMDFAQAILPGGGGWPLNLFLTPDRKPVFATTYVPPVGRGGMLGMQELIARIHALWSSGQEREKLEEQADRIVELFRSTSCQEAGEIPEADVLKESVSLLYRLADPVYGGLAGAPKFPMPGMICFLLRYAVDHKEERALYYADTTLRMMRRGGIWDHLGGGFARYSVDEHWIIPHFEKMLYDNACLLQAYTEAGLCLKLKDHQSVAFSIGDFLLREMQHPDGGFYSSQDADTQGREGKFYTWTPEEIGQVLEKREADLFCRFFDVRCQGNFEGRSVLYEKDSLQDFAEETGCDLQQLSSDIASMKQKLFQARSCRYPPIIDDKVLAGCNGLAIASLLQAGFYLGRLDYQDAALRALHFIKTHLWQHGRLWRRFCKGQAGCAPAMDDYAFLIHGLLHAFECTGDAGHLSWALEMAHILQKEFLAENGAFYSTGAEDATMILRRCELYDSAEPSGNGLHCDNLLRLHQITGNQEYLEQALGIMRACEPFLKRNPLGCCKLLTAYARHLHPGSLFVVSLPKNECGKEEIAECLRQHFSFYRLVVWRRQGNEALLALLPQLASMTPIEGQATLYICSKNQCRPPIVDKEEMERAIKSS